MTKTPWVIHAEYCRRDFLMYGNTLSYNVRLVDKIIVTQLGYVTRAPYVAQDGLEYSFSDSRDTLMITKRKGRIRKG